MIIVGIALCVEMGKAELRSLELSDSDEPVPNASALPFWIYTQACEVANLVDATAGIAGSQGLIDVGRPDERA